MNAYYKIGERTHRKGLRCTEGKIYFSQESERRFYFFLTIIMLLVGIGYKTGLFA
jgi:hypothetical protein